MQKFLRRRKRMARVVTTIPATTGNVSSQKKKSSTKRRVAGYARVSTDKDEQFTSYEAQVDYYTNYIKGRQDWTFVKIYTDEGLSGTRTATRPGFTRMVRDALAGRIDLIVTKSLSRFARNTVDSLTTIRALKAKGVECYFEKENIWTFDSKGELLITIMSSIAQEESRSISENVTWGQRKRFADGKVSVAFGRFLGYDRGLNGEFIRNDEEAKTVQQIFKLYLEGKSHYKIARILTEMNIPAPGGKGRWYDSTIKSILQNEKYVGDALLQKTFTLDYLTGAKKKNEGEVPQYYVENNHEPIINREVFDLVQAEIARRNGKAGRYNNDRLFAGKIFCAQCGGPFTRKVWHSNEPCRQVVWQCLNKYRTRDPNRCNSGHFKEDVVKDMFVYVLNQILTTEITETQQIINEVAFDTTELEIQEQQAKEVLENLTQLMENSISQNARVVQNQNAYNEEYEKLTAQFVEAKTHLEKLTASIKDKVLRKFLANKFLDDLSKIEGPIEKFDDELWFSLVDYVSVQNLEDVTFFLMDGSKIEIPFK